MSNLSSVLHPHDPAKASFDFLAWRAVRRLVADRLRPLSDLHPEAERLALAIDDETLSVADIDTLNAILAAEGEEPVTDTEGLFFALERILERHGLQAADTHHFPSVVPDWTRIPVSRAVFFGTVGGIALGARLENSARPIPPATLVWIGNGNSEREPQPVTANIGSFLDCAPAVWDWLVARRLTLLCAAGIMSWPTVAPLRIDDVSVPMRGL